MSVFLPFRFLFPDAFAVLLRCPAVNDLQVRPSVSFLLSFVFLPCLFSPSLTLAVAAARWMTCRGNRP